MSDWIPCKEIGGYVINDHRLFDKERSILVTYETKTGKRYVKQVFSERGRIPKKLSGEIIAWQEMPEPFDKKGE